jgi:NAD+ synthase
MDDSVDRIHAREVAQKFGVNFEEKSIFSALHSISNLCSSADRLELGNTCSRLRMICLYNFAKQKDAIVVGTGNKSELMTGYFTKFGDGGCDVLPIGCLLKRDVLQLAGNLGVPNAVIEKAPSAGLWEGQTDEGEMGLTYKKLDEILEVFPNFSDEDDVEFKKIKFLFNRSAHKREMPKVLNVLE